MDRKLRTLIALLGINLLMWAGTIIADSTVVHPPVGGITYDGTTVIVPSLTVSGATANRVVVTDANKALASLAAGATSQVLHGNAGGAPSFGSVVLTTDVSGILPVANGGLGFAPVTVASCSSTGLGSGGSPGCAVTSGTEHLVLVRLSTGTGSTGTTGVVTLTLGQTTPTAMGCFGQLANTGGANWNAAATTRGTGVSATAPTTGWANNGVALTVSQTYDIWFTCRSAT